MDKNRLKFMWSREYDNQCVSMADAWGQQSMIDGFYAWANIDQRTTSSIMINCPMCGSKASVQICKDVSNCVDIGCENKHCLLHRLVELYPIFDTKGIREIVNKWNSMGGV